MTSKETATEAAAFIEEVKLSLKKAKRESVARELAHAFAQHIAQNDEERPLAAAVLLISLFKALQGSKGAAALGQKAIEAVTAPLLGRLYSAKNALFAATQEQPRLTALLAGGAHVFRLMHEAAGETPDWEDLLDARVRRLLSQWPETAFVLGAAREDLFRLGTDSHAQVLAPLITARERIRELLESCAADGAPSPAAFEKALFGYRNALLEAQGALAAGEPQLAAKTRQDRDFGVFLFYELLESGAEQDPQAILRRYHDIFCAMEVASMGELRAPEFSQQSLPERGEETSMGPSPFDSMLSSRSSQPASATSLSLRAKPLTPNKANLPSAFLTPVATEQRQPSASSAERFTEEEKRATPVRPAAEPSASQRFSDLFKKKSGSSQSMLQPEALRALSATTHSTGAQPRQSSGVHRVSFSQQTDTFQPVAALEEVLLLEDFGDVAESGGSLPAPTSSGSVRVTPGFSASASGVLSKSSCAGFAPSVDSVSAESLASTPFSAAPTQHGEERLRLQLAAAQAQVRQLFEANAEKTQELQRQSGALATAAERLQAVEQRLVAQQSEHVAAMQAAEQSHAAALEMVWEELAVSETRRDELEVRLAALVSPASAWPQAARGREAVAGRAFARGLEALRVQAAAALREQHRQLRGFATTLRIFASRAKAIKDGSALQLRAELCRLQSQAETARHAEARRLAAAMGPSLLKLRGAVAGLGDAAVVELAAVFRTTTAFRSFVARHRAAVQSLWTRQSAVPRLQLLFQAAQVETAELRGRVSHLADDKSRLQRDLLELACEGGTAEAETLRRLRQLQADNKGLVDFNRRVAAQALQLKERLIRREAASQTPRLQRLVSHLELQNHELATELQRKSRAEARTPSRRAARDSQVPVRLGDSAVSGTAAVRRMDLLLNALESRRSMSVCEGAVSLFDALDAARQPADVFARNCLVGSYVLLRSPELLVEAEEQLRHGPAATHLTLELSLTNRLEHSQRVGPLRLCCRSREFHCRASSDCVTLPARETRTVVFELELSAGFVLDFAPVLLALGAEPAAPLVLPLSLNKLMPTAAEDATSCAMLAALAAVAETRAERRAAVEEKDLAWLFPRQTWLDEDSFAVKVAAAFGAFYLRVGLEGLFVVRLTAFAAGPARHIDAYLESVAEILRRL